jgi:hypothetical protein
VRALVAATALALVCAANGHAHGGGSHTGFVATVSYVEPPQLGLLVRVLGGHERLSISNLTQETVEILGEDGQPALRLAPGESGAIADPRVGSTGPPPSSGEFVKDWRIPGRADGEPFQIVGFLGYRSAQPAEDEGGWPVPAWAIALVGGVAVAAALALPLLVRREGESASESGPTGSA